MKQISRVLLAVLFVSAGSLHLIKPQPFRQIMPPRIPQPDLMVTLSGIAEILGGIGILIPTTRPTARWGLVALLAAVFPANIYMAAHNIQPTNLHIPNALLWARLPFQPLLIWWVISATTAQKAGVTPS